MCVPNACVAVCFLCVTFRYNTASACHGRAVVKVNQQPIESKPHSHAPKATSLKSAQVLSAIKTSAKTNTDSARELVVKAMGSADAPTVAALPGIKNLRRTAARYLDNGGIAHTPASVHEIVLNEANTTTARGDEFLLFDSAKDEVPAPDESKRLIVFGTRGNLKILTMCDTIAMDGTFKIAPPLFKQLFTIHGNSFKSLVEKKN